MVAESVAGTVQAYIDGVLKGTIVAGRLVRLAAERHVHDLEEGHKHGLSFDQDAAEHAISFFGFLRHSKGQWAGETFELAPWQAFIVWVLFGWTREDGTRRFRTAYLEVARKNGKTTLLAGLGLYLFFADGEPGAEVYAAATKRDQARLSHGEATRMVKSSPAIRQRIGVFRDNLHVQATGSKFEPLGADADTMDGLNVYAALIDELHAHRTRAVVDVLDTATGARRQPMIIEITTAGFDQTSVCFEHHEYSRQVLEGTIRDDAWFAFVASLDPGDDWRDEKVWPKANPNLNVSVSLDDLRRKCEKAQHMPAAQNAFMQKHMDVWTQQSDRWIDLELWDANFDRKIDEAALEGRTCYGGLDLASVLDLAAWAMLFPRDDDPDRIDVVMRFWCPEARLWDPENQYADQYRIWAAQGWITTTPGDAIDYDAIQHQIIGNEELEIVGDAQRFQIKDLNIDRLFQGYQTGQRLQAGGLTVLGFGMGFISMAAPMKEFERLLAEKKVNHGNNPVLRWMAGNMAVQQDAAGNLKPDKAESQGKIDGIVAVVMALDRRIRHMGKPRVSPYETRGVMVV